MNIHTEECNIAFTRNILYSFNFCYEIFDTWHKTIYEHTTDFKNENITNSISLCSSLVYPPASLRVISILNVIPLLKKRNSPHIYESLNHVFLSFNFFKVWFQRVLYFMMNHSTPFLRSTHIIMWNRITFILALALFLNPFSCQIIMDLYSVSCYYNVSINIFVHACWYTYASLSKSDT